MTEGSFLVARASSVDVRKPPATYGGQLAVVQVHDLAGVADQRGDVGGREHLLLADADDDRAAVAGDDEHPGLARVHDGDAVRADDLRQRPAYGVLELDGGRPGDQVRQDLAVGLGGEGDAVGLSLARSSSAFSMMPLCTTATPSAT